MAILGTAIAESGIHHYGRAAFLSRPSDPFWFQSNQWTRLGEEAVECSQLSYRNQRVSFPVASCSLSDEERYVLEED
jgi:hypothetical protein